MQLCVVVVCFLLQPLSLQTLWQSIDWDTVNGLTALIDVVACVLTQLKLQLHLLSKLVHRQH